MGMTFSKEVKEELSKIIPKARHCRIAEYAVLFWHFGEIVTENGCRRLIISCEQEMIARKCFTLTEKTFNIICGLQKNSRGFLLEITDEDAIEDILSAVKMTDTGIDAEMFVGIQHTCFSKYEHINGCNTVQMFVYPVVRISVLGLNLVWGQTQMNDCLGRQLLLHFALFLAAGSKCCREQYGTNDFFEHSL